MKAYRRKEVIFLSGVFIMTLTGCSTVKEGMRGVAGISTRSLEEARKDAITKSFDYDYLTAYNKVLEALKEIQAYVYAKDTGKRMIAIYVSEQDTTPVGIFFKETDTGKTQIEVSSASTYARELISSKLFPILTGTK